MMFKKEEHYTCATISIRIADGHEAGTDRLFELEKTAPGTDDNASGRLFSFVRNAPATFAERFPHLMVGVVAVAVMLAALTAEIDCLRGSGYFWQ